MNDDILVIRLSDEYLTGITIIRQVASRLKFTVKEGMEFQLFTRILFLSRKKAKVYDYAFRLGGIAESFLEAGTRIDKVGFQFLSYLCGGVGLTDEERKEAMDLLVNFWEYGSIFFELE